MLQKTPHARMTCLLLTTDLSFLYAHGFLCISLGIPWARRPPAFRDGDLHLSDGDNSIYWISGYKCIYTYQNASN